MRRRQQQHNNKLKYGDNLLLPLLGLVPVFTKRKGYGQGGRTDLLPKWVEGVCLGPARAVPGGHLVYGIPRTSDSFRLLLSLKEGQRLMENLLHILLFDV